MTYDAENKVNEQDEESQAAPSLYSRLASNRTRLVAGLLILLTVFGGSGYLVLTKIKERKPTAGSNITTLLRQSYQEPLPQVVVQDLAPFYIQLPVEVSGHLAKISFSVTWDRSSWTRFRNREPQIRDQIFLRMTELAAHGDGMDDMSTTFRQEAQMILEENLRPELLSVIVKEIQIT